MTEEEGQAYAELKAQVAQKEQHIQELEGLRRGLAVYRETGKAPGER